MASERASEETVSISKGCFLFNCNESKAGKTTKKKKHQRGSLKAKARYFTENKFPLLKGENSQQATLRYTCFKECWVNISEQIESIQVATNKKVFDDLLTYIKESYSEENANYQWRELPTAALLTGVNMPDHDIIFQQITSSILNDITPHVVLLHSKNCSNLKFLMREVITQLMTTDDEEDDVDENLDKSFFEEMGKIKRFTFKVLRSWYSKVSTKDSGKNPIVIILEDFEGFHKSVLQDFILIASEYIQDLPIVLVFSLATTIGAVHNSLPHSVSTRLSIEKFHAEPSLECLHIILNKVFITSQHPFKLGPRLLHVLYDKFLCQDFSIQSFASAVQFAMLEHYYDNPLSIFCTYDNKMHRNAIDSLNEDHITYLINMPSYQRFQDRKSLNDQEKLLQDIPHIKKTAKKMIDEFRKTMTALFPVLRCLHKISSKLPRAPFGKRLKDVYEFCMKQEIVKKEQYHTSIALLKQTSKDDLVFLLEECYTILADFVQENALGACFADDLPKLEQLMKKFDTLDNLSNQKDEEASATPKTPVEKIPVYKNRFELQERMRQAVKERKSTPYDNLRNEVIDCWDSIFRKYLKCPMLLPLHELFIFDAKESVMPHINPAPRLSVQNALRDPHFYLKCKCCKIDAEDTQETLPDLSIVYKIHLECGKMINLYDWMQAFVAVVAPSPAGRSNSKKRQAEDESLQARFFQSVSEMQLLGLIKPTKRKADHVQRLTWGF
ncbi:origin recognition complex subunit 3-like [Rhopilema esculentum]|uniref:origin recognition complex subunit 3-like n=1 Tax=Rhopilema esculentum TaxID=499914 RepID=UPI0031DA9D10